MVTDEPTLGKWHDKAIKALAGNHLDTTGGKALGRLALGNYLARVEAAVPPLATTLQPIITPAHVDEARPSALLLRVFKSTC